MICNEVQSVIDAYADRELSLESSLWVQRHLSTCADCSAMYANRLTLKAAIGSGSLYHAAPTNLQSKILAGIQGGSEASENGAFSAFFATNLFARSFALAASILLVACVGWYIGRKSVSTSSDSDLAQQVFASDVRSLIAVDHGIDIVSSNQHTVKPWFAGKLDFSPKVQDLAAEGFPLIGGRRDYLDGRVVAVLVYRRRLHWINLYIWPSTDRSDLTQQSLQGYQLIDWSKGGMTYWAVSDLNAAELTHFAGLVQAEK